MKKTPQYNWDWQIALLFVFMMAGASGRLVVTRWTDDLVIAQGAAIFGGILGLVLAICQFGNFARRLLVLEYSIVMLPWLFLGAAPGREELAVRLSSLFGRLSLGIGQLVRAEEVNDPLIFVAFASIIFWFIGLYSGQAVLQKQRILASFLPPSLPLLLIQYYDGYKIERIWILAVYFAAALLIIGRIQYLKNASLWREKQIFTGPEPEFDLNRSILVATITIIMLAWLLPTPAKALPAATKLWNDISRPFKISQERINNALAALTSQKPPPVERYGNVLGLGSKADQGEGIILRVRTPSTSLPRYYWRARIYETYQNGQWLSSQTLKRPFSPNSDEILTPGSEETLAEFEFEWLFAAQATLVTQSQAVWVSRPAELIYGSAEPAQIDFNGLRATPILNPGEKYVARSVLRNPTIVELREVGEEYPEWIAERYLSVPGDLPARVTALAVGIAEGADTPYDKAARITQYLRENITYSETVPPLPFAANPVEQFLFEWGSGYCTYYATTEVLMLRSLGIPARLAVGYAQGQRSSGLLVVRSKDAHAWPEVYFPGIGWVEFEPTGNQPALVRPSGIEREPQTDIEPKERQIPEFNDEPEQPIAEEESPAMPKFVFPTQTVLRWIIIISAIGFSGYGVWRLHKQKPFQMRALQTVVWFYNRRGQGIPNWVERWQRWSELTDVERSFHVINQSMALLKQNQPESITPAERVELLKKLLPQAVHEIDTLARQHEMTLYSRTPGDTAKASQAAWKIRYHVIRYLFNRLFLGASV